MFWLSRDFLCCQSPLGSPWREAGLLTLYILFPIIFSCHYFSTLFSQPNAVFPLYIVLQEYIDAHPETIILDPLPAIRTLLDRSKSYELIRRIEAYMQGRPISVPWRLLLWLEKKAASFWRLDLKFEVVVLCPLHCLSMGAQTLKHSCVTGLPSGILCSSFSIYTKEVCNWLKIRCGFNGEHIYHSEHSQKSSGKHCLLVVCW